MDHTKAFVDIVNSARSSIRETDVGTVRARLDRGDRFYLIDVREESEWHSGHLPDAIHVGKGVIERDIEGIVSDFDAEIVLYCGGGYRSALAAVNLGRMGFTNVLSMDGGFREWTERGYTVSADS